MGQLFESPCNEPNRFMCAFRTAAMFTAGVILVAIIVGILSVIGVVFVGVTHDMAKTIEWPFWLMLLVNIFGLSVASFIIYGFKCILQESNT